MAVAGIPPEAGLCHPGRRVGLGRDLLGAGHSGADAARGGGYIRAYQLLGCRLPAGAASQLPR